MRATVLTLLLTACTTADHAMLGDEVVDLCGPPPLAPGWSVYVENERATMSIADYVRLTVWRDEVSVWRDCIVSLP